MDDNGWIAREQILGPEARSKVPKEFVAQNKRYANPPALLMPLVKLARDLSKDDHQSFSIDLEDHEIIISGPDESFWEVLRHEPTIAKRKVKALIPRLEKHYQWYLKTQRGDLDETVFEKARGEEDLDPTYTFRWRGRSDDHTLSSGLDDYPRAQNASKNELHVDLLTWMAFSASSLQQINQFLGLNSSNHTSEYKAMVDNLNSRNYFNHSEQ